MRNEAPVRSCQGERFRWWGFCLCDTLMALVAVRGFREMRLETGSLNDEAVDLYGRLGFRGRAPQNDYPDDVRALLRFMSADLTVRFKAGHDVT